MNPLLHPRASTVYKRRPPYTGYTEREYTINKDKGMIYAITNHITGQRYIGATTRSLGNRFKEHRKVKKLHSALTRDMDTFNPENFSIKHIATALEIGYLSELEALIVTQEQPYYNTQKPVPNYHWLGRTKGASF